MLNPNITFLSIPRTSLRISGPFERLLRPLLRRLQIPEPASDRIVVPCLTQQLPSILSRFADVVAMFTSQCAHAQASMRTVTISPELDFPYHLKLALACQITSALRTITPWTACGGLAVSELLQKLLSPDLWVFKEAAAVCGSQADFNEAKHLSCILREDLEARATASGETLILAAALAQRSVNDSRSNAERVFALDTLQKRQDWFRRYVFPYALCSTSYGATVSMLRIRRMILATQLTRPTLQLYILPTTAYTSTSSPLRNLSGSSWAEYGWSLLPQNPCSEGLRCPRLRRP